jgi:hypothetical protein
VRYMEVRDEVVKVVRSEINDRLSLVASVEVE